MTDHTIQTPKLQWETKQIRIVRNIEQETQHTEIFHFVSFNFCLFLKEKVLGEFSGLASLKPLKTKLYKSRKRQNLWKTTYCAQERRNKKVAVVQNLSFFVQKTYRVLWKQSHNVITFLLYNVELVKKFTAMIGNYFFKKWNDLTPWVPYY